MFPENYFIYIQLILFYFITPGPPRVVIVSNTINYGLRKSVWTAFGDISANFVQASLVTFIIGSLLIDNPGIYVYFKWAGILYILYLAYETLTLKIKEADIKNKVFRSNLAMYRDGFLVAGLSPKALVFFGTIFLTFINFEKNVISQFLILISTWMILDFLSLMMYGLAARKVAVWLKGNPRTLNTISACVLIIIALYVGIRT
jgi:threonine/homoserine/homoserine lactone efflux protein